jgi:hypothetical protein
LFSICDQKCLYWCVFLILQNIVEIYCARKNNRQQMTSNLSGVQQLLRNLKKSLTQVLVKFKFLKCIDYWKLQILTNNTRILPHGKLLKITNTN